MSGGQYLIVRLAAIGDVVMMSTLVREIRRRDHQAHITWLCGRVAQPLVELFEVDEVIAVDEADLLQGKPVRRVRAVLDVWRRLRRRSFDQTLLGYADRRYRLLLAPVRTGRVRALEHATSPRMLPVPGRYFGDECVRLLDEEDSRGPIAGHFPLAEVRRSLAAPERPGDIGVVLGPGGARNVLREDALRRWPAQRYRELAEQLLAAGYRVTLVGDASDAWVRSHFAGLDVRDEIGRHAIPATLGLLHAADLVIVHDTGILHMARLVGAPVIALFGPTPPARFLVEAPDALALWGGADLACRPCYTGREYAACTNNLCIQRIEVAEVMRQAEGLIASRRLARVFGINRGHVTSSDTTDVR